MISSFSTAFYDKQDRLVSSRGRIALRHFRSWFIVDVLLRLLLIQHHAAHICSAEAERSSGAQTLSLQARRARRSSSAATILLRARYQLAISLL